jgi:hypothetical protein
MGYTAFGYENKEGVSYGLVDHPWDLDDLIEIIEDHEIPDHLELDKTTSVSLYFDDELFYSEDVRWRVLYRLDGTVQCRIFSMQGIFTYRIPREPFNLSPVPENLKVLN